jgi:formate-dependent nitrite reductase membrane component NrfD
MREHIWTWPIAGYLFLGGLGAGMTFVATAADLLLGLGSVFAPCVIGAIVALGLGSFLLIFELGRPLQFWRVFSRQTAVLTFGAWMVVGLIVVDALYFSFLSGWFPWSAFTAGQAVCGVLGLALAFGVLVYTGVELSGMKARPFWNTPALPILFVASGILTGVGADFLLVGLWPSSGGTAVLLVAKGVLVVAALALTVATLFMVLLYVLMMFTSSDRVARKAAVRWLTGSYAVAFWGGLIGIGLVAPLLLLVIGGSFALVLASLLVVAGGLCLRFLVVYSDDRRQFNGEDLRRSRLPQGDEEFLTRNWG